MRNFAFNIIPRFLQQHLPPTLSRGAKQRLRVLDWYHTHGGNARLTCRHFGISPDTFYRWKRRYNPWDLPTLEAPPHPPPPPPPPPPAARAAARGVAVPRRA